MNEMSCSREIPLIDLHIHLDGALSVSNIKKLAEIQNIELNMSDAELLSLISVARDCCSLNDFLCKFDFPLQFLQTKEGLAAAVTNLCNELEEEGLIYAEIRLAPQLSCKNGLSQRDVVNAALSGLKQGNLKANLILCCMRQDDNKEENLETVHLTAEFLGKGVVATDLAGAEAIFSNENFAYVFEEAKKLSVPFTIHAGEAAGAESVKSALDFGASRIGHGVRSIEDIAVVKELADKHIPLEMCITSNLQTQAVASLHEYPIKKLMESGVAVTLNTDDPAISCISLKSEWELAVKNFGFGKTEMRQLLLNSANASFADSETKKYLISAIERYFANARFA